MYKRQLNNIPLDEKDYKDELNTIKYLAETNRYNRTIVNKPLHKTQNKQQTKTENNKFITLTYINKQTEKITNKFKKAGYRIAYKTTNKTEHTLSKHKKKFDLPGVYKLNCSNCNKFYIGQTGHSFKQRYIEHTKACLLYTSRCV